MKALTLTQPWATLVAVGAKRIETRSWTTTYRGPLAIHAAKGLPAMRGPMGMTEQDLVDLCDSEPFFTALRPHLSGYTARERAADLPRGQIIAVASLTDVVRTGEAWSAEADEQERAFGDFTPGRYAWLLERVINIYDGIECRGALHLWTIPPTVQAQLAKIDDRAA